MPLSDYSSISNQVVPNIAHTPDSAQYLKAYKQSLRNEIRASRQSPLPGRATDQCASTRHNAKPLIKIKLLTAVAQDQTEDRKQARATAAATMHALQQSTLYEEEEISWESLTLTGRHPHDLAGLLRSRCDLWLENFSRTQYERLIFIVADSNHELGPVLGELPADDEIITVCVSQNLTQDIKTAMYLPAIVAVRASSVKDSERAALETKTTMVLVPDAPDDPPLAPISGSTGEHPPTAPHANLRTVTAQRIADAIVAHITAFRLREPQVDTPDLPREPG